MVPIPKPRESEADREKARWDMDKATDWRNGTVREKEKAPARPEKEEQRWADVPARRPGAVAAPAPRREERWEGGTAPMPMRSSFCAHPQPDRQCTLQQAVAVPVGTMSCLLAGCCL